MSIILPLSSFRARSVTPSGGRKPAPPDARHSSPEESALLTHGLLPGLYHAEGPGSDSRRFRFPGATWSPDPCRVVASAHARIARSHRVRARLAFSRARAHWDRAPLSTPFPPTPLGSRRFFLPAMPDPTGIGRSSPSISGAPQRARATRTLFSSASRRPRPLPAAPPPASSSSAPHPGRMPGHTPCPAGTAPAAASPAGRARPRRARSPG